MTDRVVLWDFDGTLAWRDGLWSGCVLEVLDEHEPGHGVTVEAIRAGLSGGFPWHRHNVSHPELAEADAWWRALAALLVAAMSGGGVSEQRARELAPAVRERFVDGTRVWRAFDDVPEALRATAQRGWRNVILSNHVPELPQLVDQLGLGALVDGVFSSASTGYEKPHPEAFRGVLRACGEPTARWMVGDNPHADFAGAEALGIPAVLIRSDAPVRRSAPDAAGAAAVILGAVHSARAASPEPPAQA